MTGDSPESSGGFWIEVHGTEDARSYVLAHKTLGGASPGAPPSRVWTVSAVASEAGISEARVRKLLREGRFPNAFKLGRPWLVPDADVRAYLAHPDMRLKDVPRQATLPIVNA